MIGRGPQPSRDHPFKKTHKLHVCRGSVDHSRHPIRTMIINIHRAIYIIARDGSVEFASIEEVNKHDYW